MVNTLGDITLIALAVIYIPIVVLIVRKWKAKSTRFIGVPLAIVLLPVLFFVIFFHLPYYELKGFEGKVIDGETKQPIQGAAVLAVYYDEAVTIAGTNTYPIDARETVTNEKGEFTIPEVKEWFGERLGTVVESKLTIFKPGYGVYPGHKHSSASSEERGQPTRKNEVVYQLPKLKTREERKSNLPTRPELPDNKISSFVDLINQERVTLGYRPLATLRGKSR